MTFLGFGCFQDLHSIDVHLAAIAGKDFGCDFAYHCPSLYLSISS